MRRLKHFAFNAIKESFDMLPTAVCFFDCSGGIVLCNRQMYRLSRYLLDSDMQYLGEVEQALFEVVECRVLCARLQGEVLVGVEHDHVREAQLLLLVQADELVEYRSEA